MQLTRAEEQIMQILWDLEEGVVKDIREKFDDPKPARNTISTVLKVLEKKMQLMDVFNKSATKLKTLIQITTQKNFTSVLQNFLVVLQSSRLEQQLKLN